MENTSLNKNERIILIILLVGNLLSALNSTFAFLVFKAVPFHLWLVFNICAPVIYVTTAAMLFELKGKRFISWQIAMVVFLFRFGTGGMFTFPWSGYMLASQFGHILMTILAGFIIYIIYKTEDDEKKKKVIGGFIIGLVVVLLLDLVLFPVIFSDPQVMSLLDSMNYDMNFGPPGE